MLEWECCSGEAIGEAARFFDGGFGSVPGPAAEADLMFSPEFGFSCPFDGVLIGGRFAMVRVAVEDAKAAQGEFVGCH